MPEKSQVKETHQILRPQTLHSPDHFSSFHGGKCWKTSAFVTEFMTIIPKALDYTGINIVIGTENIQSPNLKSHTVNGRCFLDKNKGREEIHLYHTYSHTMALSKMSYRNVGRGQGKTAVFEYYLLTYLYYIEIFKYM